jgi:hypothetical protein
LNDQASIGEAMVLRRALWLLTCGGLSVAASTSVASAQVIKLAEARSWQVFGGLNSGNPTCAVTGAAESGMLSFSAEMAHPDIVQIALVRGAWNWINGRRIAVQMTFAGGQTQRLIGIGDGINLTVELRQGALAPWLHEFTARDAMAVSFEGIEEAPWTFDLKGTTAAVTAMSDCTKALGFTSLPAPFTSAVAVPPVAPPVVGTFTPNSQGLAILKAVVRNDAISRWSGGPALLNWDYRAPEVKATPDEIYQAYRANALAADLQFKNKRILIIGTVLTVQADYLGKPYIEFRTSGSLFENVKGYLKEQAAQEAVNWRPGQRVDLECVGASKVAFEPTLLGCASLTPERNRAADRAEMQMEQWISGYGSDATNQSTPQLRDTLFAIYWAGAHLPAGSACFIRVDEPQCNADMTHVGEDVVRRSPQYLADRQAAADVLGLGPLPTPNVR